MYDCLCGRRRSFQVYISTCMSVITQCLHFFNIFSFSVCIFLTGFKNFQHLVMLPVQIFVALSGFAVAVIFGQSQNDFADTPPRPEKGAMLEITCTHQEYLSLPCYIMRMYPI